MILLIHTALCQLFGELRIFGKLDIVIGLILHEYSFQVNIITDFIATQVNVSLSCQSLRGVKIPETLRNKS